MFPQKETLSSQNIYTLQKVEGKSAFINIVSTLATKEGTKMTYNGMEMNLDLNGDLSGTMEVDIETGMPVHSASIQHLKGNIEVQGQKIPMAMSGDMTMKFRKL
ncbi:MAG: DUF6263 family protein [Niabella sp.]